MSAVYVIIRTINEKTLNECLNKVKELGFPYTILENYKPLEKASKETIRIGSKLESYGWVMALDADVILSMTKQDIEKYCSDMEKEFHDNLFCFTGFVDCTQRGIISGIHFFRTKYCKQVYEYVKEKCYDFHQGREEYEICQTVKNELFLGVVEGLYRIPFGKHIFEAQIIEIN